MHIAGIPMIVATGGCMNAACNGGTQYGMRKVNAVTMNE
jgi:hypothetical protein